MIIVVYLIGNLWCVRLLADLVNRAISDGDTLNSAVELRKKLIEAQTILDVAETIHAKHNDCGHEPLEATAALLFRFA